jgi:hypothetical protein
MWNPLRDIHQNLSFKLRYAHGKRGVPFKCPWWADSMVFGLGYIEGKGVGMKEEPTNASSFRHDIGGE